nr:HNH endonuclease family protein [Actinomycetes bacterium]
DDYKVQERFFRHYYNAFKDELPAVAKAPIATRSNLIRIYEKIIDVDLKERLDDILLCGGIYRRIVGNLDADEATTSFDEALADLTRVQGAPAEALLLYLMTYQDDLDLTEPQLKAVAETLTSFFVRRNLTGDPPTNALQRLFMSIIADVSSMTGRQIVDRICKRLRGVASSDRAFHTKLTGPLYNENADVARYILVALARADMTNETFTDLWEREGKHYRWTIEHILPQGPGLPKEWLTMLGGADSAAAIQQQHVHRLGNLTITGYNSTLGNRSFHSKKIRKDSKGNFVGFKNGFPLNADVVEAAQWTAAEIDDRTKKLAKRVLSLFPL